jgi:hypothetical protein
VALDSSLRAYLNPFAVAFLSDAGPSRAPPTAFSVINRPGATSYGFLACANALAMSSSEGLVASVRFVIATAHIFAPPIPFPIAPRRPSPSNPSPFTIDHMRRARGFRYFFDFYRLASIDPFPHSTPDGLPIWGGES